MCLRFVFGYFGSEVFFYGNGIRMRKILSKLIRRMRGEDVGVLVGFILGGGDCVKDNDWMWGEEICIWVEYLIWVCFLERVGG